MGAVDLRLHTLRSYNTRRVIPASATFQNYETDQIFSIVLSHYGTTGNSASRCRALIAYELSFLELLTIAVEIILVIRGTPLHPTSEQCLIVRQCSSCTSKIKY